MTPNEVRTLKRGDRLTMLIDTIGCDEDDNERIQPAGATAVVDTVETLPAPQGLTVHVIIGDTIMNVFDEADGYPFERSA